ncbi:MAG TPA: 50S ribosomal protein L31 [Rickettsiales bacterium]|nr:50S ribosomal protein L31 [Rickettsiales bacterium]
MAQKDIHLDSHTIIIQTTDGNRFETKSCYGEEGSVINLDTDPYNHPAWKDGKQAFVNIKDDQIAKFNKKKNWGFK